IPLTNLLTVVDDVNGIADIIEINFGALGLGGAAVGAISSYWSALEQGDGYYELDIDLNNTGDWSKAAPEFFYRLLGDVNGDQAVNASDLNAITAALGQSGPFVNADVNGSGLVNTTDKQLAAKSRNDALATGLHLDD
ncbi:MAG TPA: dockerin type I domain-containing protein, partial [Pirellulales bacterium]